jgi:hypothetical protein
MASVESVAIAMQRATTSHAIKDGQVHVQGNLRRWSSGAREGVNHLTVPSCAFTISPVVLRRGFTLLIDTCFPVTQTTETPISNAHRNIIPR